MFVSNIRKNTMNAPFGINSTKFAPLNNSFDALSSMKFVIDDVSRIVSFTNKFCRNFQHVFVSAVINWDIKLHNQLKKYSNLICKNWILTRMVFKNCCVGNNGSIFS